MYSKATAVIVASRISQTPKGPPLSRRSSQSPQSGPSSSQTRTDKWASHFLLVFLYESHTHDNMTLPRSSISRQRSQTCSERSSRRTNLSRVSQSLCLASPSTSSSMSLISTPIKLSSFEMLAHVYVSISRTTTSCSKLGASTCYPRRRQPDPLVVQHRPLLSFPSSTSRASFCSELS